MRRQPTPRTPQRRSLLKSSRKARRRHLRHPQRPTADPHKRTGTRSSRFSSTSCWRNTRGSARSVLTQPSNSPSSTAGTACTALPRRSLAKKALRSCFTRPFTPQEAPQSAPISATLISTAQAAKKAAAKINQTRASEHLLRAKRGGRDLDRHRAMARGKRRSPVGVAVITLITSNTQTTRNSSPYLLQTPQPRKPWTWSTARSSTRPRSSPSPRERPCKRRVQRYANT